jgi:ankyrin repeat protein
MDGKKLLRNVVMGCFFLGNYFLKAEQTSDDVINSKEFELFSAASKQNKELVKVLLENGANANKCFQDNRTALHEAALYGSIAIMRTLLAYGADPNLLADGGHSPLHLAMYCGSLKRAALLLDCGADPNARDEEGKTPLMWLVDAIIHQITKKAEKNKAVLKIKKSLLPSHPWERANDLNCYFDMIRLLVDRGANPNVQDNEGRTALDLAVLTWLHWAAPNVPPPLLHRQPQVELVRILIELGADPTIKDNYGETALDIFEQSIPPCTQEEIDRASANDIPPEYRDEYDHRNEIIELLDGTVGESSSEDEAEDSEN